MVGGPRKGTIQICGGNFSNCEIHNEVLGAKIMAGTKDRKHEGPEQGGKDFIEWVTFY